MEYKEPELAAEHPAETPSPWKGGDVLIITLAALAIFAAGFWGIGLVLRRSGAGDGASPSILLSVALGALEGVALIGSIALFGVWRKRLSWKALGLRQPSPGWWLIAFFIGLFVIPVSGLIAVAIQMILRQPVENTQLPFLIPEGFSWVGAITMLALGGLVAPLAEEMFFRGLLFNWMRNRWGVPAGIIASSILFGIVHGEASVGGAAAVLGIVLAWVYQRSKSLWPAVLIHAINNSVKIVLLYAMTKGGFLTPPF